MDSQSISHAANEEAKELVREARPWVIRFGRFGFAAIGIVYILIGFLAAYSIINISGEATGTTGALEQITQFPLGQFLLIAVAIGLVCHALWRLTEALMDTDERGSDSKGFFIRTLFVFVGIFYFGLAFSAVKIALGARIDSGFWAYSLTAWLLAQPFGQILVALTGAVIFAGGLYFFYEAYNTQFRETLLFNKMTTAQEKWGTRFGRFGFAARAVVFCIIGIFIIFAAWYSDPGETRSFGGALRVVEQQAFGSWLLGIVAAGLFSYGIFMLFLAKFRRMASR